MKKPTTKPTIEQEDVAINLNNLGYFNIYDQFIAPHLETITNDWKYRKSASMQMEQVSEDLETLVDQRRTFAQHFLRSQDPEEKVEIGISIKQLNDEISKLLVL